MPSAALRRTGVGLVDQTLYSVLNLAIGVFVARGATPEAFGAFSAIYVVFLIVSATVRGLASETLLVAYSDATAPRWRRGARAASAVSLTAGVLSGAVLIAAGLLVLPSAMEGAAVGIGIIMPALLVQDAMRFAALAAARPGLALANDGLVAVLQIGLSVLLALRHEASVTAYISVWGGANLAGGLLGGLLLRLSPSTRLRYWFLRNGRLAYRYAADDLIGQLVQQSSVYVVAGAVGLTGVAALRAALTVFGPLFVVYVGVMSIITPELVRTLRNGTAHLARRAGFLALAISLSGVIWTVVVLLAPDSVGPQLFGASWHLAKPLVIFVGVSFVFSGAQIGYISALRALGAARRTLRTRIIVSAIALATTTPGGLLGGPRGVAIAMLVASPIYVLIWRHQVRAAVIEWEAGAGHAGTAT